MAKVNLTAGRIANFQCAEGKSQEFLWCAEVSGLAVRATFGSNAKRFIFQTKVKGKTMRLTLGKVSTWTIDEAKAEARRLQVEIDKGNDPRQQEIEKEAAEVAEQLVIEEMAEAQRIKKKRETLTLGMVWPLYIESRRKRWSEWSIRDHENIALVGG